MVGAGALVPPGMVVPSGTLVLGAPARVKRDLTARGAGLLPDLRRELRRVRRALPRRAGAMTAVEALQKAAALPRVHRDGPQDLRGDRAREGDPGGLADLRREHGRRVALHREERHGQDHAEDAPTARGSSATVGPGEHLGELALLGQGVRLVSAVAATPCEVLEITQRDFARLQPQKPQACLKLALAIAQDLAQRVAENRELLRELAARKPAGP